MAQPVRISRTGEKGSTNVVCGCYQLVTTRTVLGLGKFVSGRHVFFSSAWTCSAEGIVTWALKSDPRHTFFLFGELNDFLDPPSTSFADDLWAWQRSVLCLWHWQLNQFKTALVLHYGGQNPTNFKIGCSGQMIFSHSTFMSVLPCHPSWQEREYVGDCLRGRYGLPIAGWQGKEGSEQMDDLKMSWSSVKNGGKCDDLVWTITNDGLDHDRSRHIMKVARYKGQRMSHVTTSSHTEDIGRWWCLSYWDGLLTFPGVSATLQLGRFEEHSWLGGGELSGGWV